MLRLARRIVLDCGVELDSVRAVRKGSVIGLHLWMAPVAWNSAPELAGAALLKGILKRLGGRGEAMIRTESRWPRWIAAAFFGWYFARFVRHAAMLRRVLDRN
jgi:hypothetical protein